MAHQLSRNEIFSFSRVHAWNFFFFVDEKSFIWYNKEYFLMEHKLEDFTWIYSRKIKQKDIVNYICKVVYIIEEYTHRWIHFLKMIIQTIMLNEGVVK